LNIDPWSRTSPKAIIDRWNDRNNKFNINMTIVTMRDSEYVEDYAGEMEIIEKRKSVSSKNRVKYLYHKKRQKLFYKSCSKHLIHQNKSWTSYIDTDEFLTFEDSSQKMEEPGYVLHKLNEIKKQLPPDTHVNDIGNSCLVVDRRKYCAKESSTEEINELFSPSLDNTIGGIVPEGFMNSSIDSTDDDHKAIVGRFDTLRYKYLTKGLDGRPKSFIDLSQRNPKLYVQDQNKTNPNKWTSHKVMHSLCRAGGRHRLGKFERMARGEKFIVNHYLGSFESFSFRNDARGGVRASLWKERATETEGEVSQAIRPWLRGFVELVGGPNVASYLLQHAGKFTDDYDVISRINDYNSTYDYKKIQKRKE